MKGVVQENALSETDIKLQGLYHKNFWKFTLGYIIVESEVVNSHDVDLPRFLRRDSEVLREQAVFVKPPAKMREKLYI